MVSGSNLSKVMKLFIQIPCFNEETTLPETVRDLPRTISGVDSIEYLVVDDGSTDATISVARALGVQHVLCQGTNRGLARAFSAGVAYALEHGADILVNTDGDNQYCGADIPLLVAPILDNKAEIVVGCRPILAHKEFGLEKKGLQLCGSWALRKISKTDVRDAPSGFRAFSRSAMQRIFIHSSFSYCMETLIQAGTTGMRVASVDVRVNPKTRESRLFKSIPQYLRKTGGTMLAMSLLYRPGAFFSLLAAPFLFLALFLGVRFVWLVYVVDNPGETHHVPSLILLAICVFFSLILFLMAIIGTLLQAQRRLAEETVFLQRKALEK